jgi:undecaprenyl-diphosphatase
MINGMTILDAGVLGVIEGLTEFLPVSSTGHLILASTVLGLPSVDFLKSFEIIIQLGAILAVVVLYWRSFLSIPILTRLLVAFIPTGIIGLALYHIVKTYLLGNTGIVLAALFFGGVLLIIFERYHRESESDTESPQEMTYGQSVIVGICQAAAIIPGVSRSAATIVGGLALGIRRKAIVEFSFLLAVPTMLAATGLDLVKNASAFSASDVGVLAIGFIISFIVALAAIKFFLSFIREHTFIPFGIYRIVISILFFFVLFH